MYAFISKLTHEASHDLDNTISWFYITIDPNQMLFLPSAGEIVELYQGATNPQALLPGASESYEGKQRSILLVHVGKWRTKH